VIAVSCLLVLAFFVAVAVVQSSYVLGKQKKCGYFNFVFSGGISGVVWAIGVFYLSIAMRWYASKELQILQL